MSDFGSAFKNARESMGLTLEQIAAETRIGTRFLDAIEKEAFHLLPGGIFSRGFVRSYAEQLKLDPDKAVADFERQSSYREPALMESLRVSVPPPEKSNRSLYPIAVFALLALVIIFYLVTRQSAKSVDAGSPPSRVAAATPTQAPPPPAQTATPAPAASNPEDGLTPNPAATVKTPSPAPVPTPAPTQPTAPAPSNSLTIVLSAHDATWIKILADGKSVNPGEILQPGTTRRYTAQASIGLSVGNAGGIDIQVNDRALRALGKSGQVRSLTITPGNLKDLTD